MRFKCVIFDLDGTLVDTIADIASSMNRALSAHGFPQVHPLEYTKMVGWGIKRLAQLALPPGIGDGADGQRLVEAVAQDATRFYAERPLVHAAPYPGIVELVTELKQHKIKTAVLSNKPDPVARLVVEGLFPPYSFNAIYGDREGVARKPDPTAAWDILLEVDSTPRETIFVGDSEIDIETAHAAGCPVIGVSWGFRTRQALENARAEWIIEKPRELLDIILNAYI
jgi:phosphoglycolate phosphatase